MYVCIIVNLLFFSYSSWSAQLQDHATKNPVEPICLQIDQVILRIMNHKSKTAAHQHRNQALVGICSYLFTQPL